MMVSPIVFASTLARPHPGELKNSTSHEPRNLRIMKLQTDALMRHSPEPVLHH
jgi:hypothetical protein